MDRLTDLEGLGRQDTISEEYRALRNRLLRWSFNGFKEFSHEDAIGDGNR